MTKRFANRVTGFIIVLISGLTPLKAQNLSEIFELALQNDPNLKKAEAEQSASKESRQQSLARFFPVISATASTSRVSQSNAKTNVIAVPQQEYWNNMISINLTQPIFHWDHWVQLSQSDNQIAQAEAAYHSEMQNLMLKTTETYFNVLSAEDNLQFAKTEKQSIARQLEQAKMRFEVGIIPITDVNEAQAGYDQANANEIEAANLVDDKLEALKEIIGEQEISLAALVKTIPLIPPEPQAIDDWSQSAAANNFNIIAALNQAEVARKSIALQFNGHLPKLDVVAAYQETDNTNIFGTRGDTQSVGLQFNMPLFEGGAVNSRTRQARHEYEAAQENLIAVKRSVTRQVKDAYRDVITAINRVQALETAVVSSAASLEASQAGLEVGTRTMVEVLNEQSSLFRAKRDFSRARYDYLINSIKLKQLASNLTRDDLEQISRLLLAGKSPEQPALR